MHVKGLASWSGWYCIYSLICKLPVFSPAATVAFYHLLALELQSMALGLSSGIQGCLPSRDELPCAQMGSTSRKDAGSSQLHHLPVVLCWE